MAYIVLYIATSRDGFIDIHEGIALPPQIFDTLRYVGSKEHVQGIVEKRYVRR